jgi:hypothetical protein
MQKIKLYFNILNYKLKKIIYNLLTNYKIIYNFFITIKKLYIILEVLIYEIIWDINVLYSNYNILIIKLKKLSIIKLIILLFLTILGIIPFIIIIYTLFYLIKYIIKYILLILDFYFNDDKKIYNKIKFIIINFFEKTPIILFKIYKFLFKSNWTLFFFKKFINFLKKIKNKILAYIFKKFDYFILILLPKFFYKYKDKITDDYRIYIIISFYKIKRKILITWPWRIKLYILKLYKKIHLRIYKKYILTLKLKYQLNKLKLKKIYRKIYYIIKFKYTYIKFNLIWFLKVFIKSEACRMTIYAFFKLNYFRIRAYIIYIFMHIYYNITYNIIFKIYNLNIYFLKINIYLNIYWFKYILWYREKIKYKSSFIFRIYLAIAYHLFIWWVIILLKTDFWIDFKDECYFLEYGDRSQSWWNLKLYSIVVKFFSKAYITNLFFHTLDWKNIIYIARYYFWWFGNFKIFILDLLSYTWDHIILRKPFKKVEFKFNRFD